MTMTGISSTAYRNFLVIERVRQQTGMRPLPAHWLLADPKTLKTVIEQLGGKVRQVLMSGGHHGLFAKDEDIKAAMALVRIQKRAEKTP